MSRRATDRICQKVRRGLGLASQLCGKGAAGQAGTRSGFVCSWPPWQRGKGVKETWCRLCCAWSVCVSTGVMPAWRLRPVPSVEEGPASGGEGSREPVAGEGRRSEGRALSAEQAVGGGRSRGCTEHFHLQRSVRPCGFRWACVGGQCASVCFGERVSQGRL